MIKSLANIVVQSASGCCTGAIVDPIAGSHTALIFNATATARHS